MQSFPLTVSYRRSLADLVTPVGLYLKLRDQFPGALLLESSDYQSQENSFSFLCLEPMADFIGDGDRLTLRFPDGSTEERAITGPQTVPAALQEFLQAFPPSAAPGPAKINGLFGYAAYDAIPYFEDIRFANAPKAEYAIPALRYHLYRYIIAINHFKNELYLLENRLSGQESGLDRLQSLIRNRDYASYPFRLTDAERSNLTDEAFMGLVTAGKDHCQKGDVFQIVLSRQFAQGFEGDEFNVYRALRSINPSPYLFYFDYGSYRLFGSSPEAQLVIENDRAYINPIAGTFRRTGDDERDRELAQALIADEKENAEHVMLVDLARNDLSRASDDVKVDTYRQVQYFSHVIHLVSKVSGRLPQGANPVRVLGDSFPAGTLSGAPKYKAMQLIDHYEDQARSYYGGALGYLGFDGNCNHAIMIRSFLSKGNTLFYQAGAGIVSGSQEASELQEVQNKLAALKTALLAAQETANASNAHA